MRTAWAIALAALSCSQKPVLPPHPPSGARSSEVGGERRGKIWDEVEGRPETERRPELDPLEDLRFVAAGGSHTCAVSKDQRVRCWGHGEMGQLGNGDLQNSSLPVDVLGISRVSMVAVRGAHTCALLVAGRVVCWGRNKNGQLGDGSNFNQSRPTPVVGLERGVTSLATGGFHNCAVKEGRAYCWGGNRHGQVGDGETKEDHNQPVAVTGLSSVLEVTAGSRHTCALTADHEVFCWGWNGHGQLGIEDRRLESPSPIRIDGFGGKPVRISAGGDHTCVLLERGRAQCWGENGFGQLGNGQKMVSTSAEPSFVEALREVTAISGGYNHSCAIVGGLVFCWGNGFSGTLGDGDFRKRNFPLPVVGLRKEAVAVSAGGNHSCALLSDSTLQCWGQGTSGELGRGGRNPKWIAPGRVVGLRPETTHLSAGETHTCARSKDGAVQCWGHNDQGQVGPGPSGSRMNHGQPVLVPNIGDDALAVAAGATHTCVLKKGDTVQCWGDDGRIRWPKMPAPVPPLNPVGFTFEVEVLQLVAGREYACVLLKGGTVRCWFHEPALNSSFAKHFVTTPLRVPALDNAVSIAACDRRACVVDDKGAVRCWEARRLHPDRGTPFVSVVGPWKEVKAHVCGRDHNCVLAKDGTVWCWGSDRKGLLGDDRELREKKVPVRVRLDHPVDVLTAGDWHNCAAGRGGVHCWGAGMFGQLNGRDKTDHPIPTKGPSLAHPVAAMTGGRGHTCALLVNGEVICWGANTYGQLGSNASTSRNLPAAVLRAR